LEPMSARKGATPTAIFHMGGGVWEREVYLRRDAHEDGECPSAGGCESSPGVRKLQKFREGGWKYRGLRPSALAINPLKLA